MIYATQVWYLYLWYSAILQSSKGFDVATVVRGSAVRCWSIRERVPRFARSWIFAPKLQGSFASVKIVWSSTTALFFAFKVNNEDYKHYKCKMIPSRIMVHVLLLLNNKGVDGRKRIQCYPVSQFSSTWLPTILTLPCSCMIASSFSALSCLSW